MAQKHTETGMPRRASQRIATLVVAVLCGLLLNGCDLGDFLADLLRFNSTASAQNEIRVETIVINTSKFTFTTDVQPDITIFDGTTRYDITASADLLFDASGITRLEAGDIMIERPGTSSSIITIIRKP